MCSIQHSLRRRRRLFSAARTTRDEHTSSVFRFGVPEEGQSSCVHNKGAVWQVGPDSRIDRCRVTDRNRFADPKIRPSRRRSKTTTRTTAITTTSVNHPHPIRNFVTTRQQHRQPFLVHHKSFGQTSRTPHIFLIIDAIIRDC